MRPRLLDLFCGAGGSAVGYHRAGFDVVGVDNRPQPHYPFEFVQDDALEYIGSMIRMDEFGLGWEIEAIHASPPCQHYANVTRWRGNQHEHPDLIGPTRDLLEATGLPYVLENVRTRALRGDFMLCGTALGLPFRRHRHFETSWSGLVMSHGCQHRPTDYSFDHGAKQPESIYRDALGGSRGDPARLHRTDRPPAPPAHQGGSSMNSLAGFPAPAERAGGPVLPQSGRPQLNAAQTREATDNA